MSSRMSRILQSPSLIVASRLGSAALGLVSAPLIARALGPDGRGTTAGALAIVGLLPIVLGFGIPLVVRRLSVDSETIGPAIRSARIFSIVAVAPSLLIAWGATFFLPTLQSGPNLIAFLIAAGTAPLAILWICDANVLIAQRRNGHFALISIVPAFVSVGIIAVSWGFDILSVPIVLLANVAATLATLVLTTFLTRVRLIGDHLPLLPFLRQGGKFAGSQLSEAASYRLDQVIALPLIGASEAGLYSVAATISLIPYSIGQAVGTAIFRHVALAENDEDKVQRTAVAMRIGFLAGAVSAAGLAIVTPFLVPLIFGSEFVGAVGPTLWSLIGSVAVVLSYVAASVFTASGRGWLMTIAQVSGLIVGIGALFILAPILGAEGASIASSAGYWVCAIICLARIRVPFLKLLPRLGDFKATVGLLAHGRFADSK